MTATAGKERKGARNGSIELLRFLTAVGVAGVHFTQAYRPGTGRFECITVMMEFFFMLTGFFMMKSILAETPERPGLPACDAVLYSFRKGKALFLPYIVAVLLCFVVRQATSAEFTWAKCFGELFHFKWEYLMLHLAGFTPDPKFGVDYLMGPGWFLSAMLIALVPAYYLAKKHRENYAGVIAPLSAMGIYFYIMQNYGTLDVGNQLAGVAMLGTLRAFAGISVGAFCCQIAGWVKRSGLKERSRAWDIANVLSWGAVALLPVLDYKWFPRPDVLFWVLPLGFLILSADLGRGVVSNAIARRSGKGVATLGKLSMYLYLFHAPLMLAWRAVVPPVHLWINGIAYIAVSVLLGAGMMVLHGRLTARKAARERATGV
ncbi:MAG: acyltransferase [Clostridia bacterium]|nr:acyltransferase [Clostridia bacterium]